jgi:LuxR family maltose regulon positive regulatory protein
VFEFLVRDGAMAFDRRDWAGAKSTLERALALYRGDFLADEPYAVWALGERERLHELAAQGHRMLVELHAAADELDAATRRAEALVNLEPWDSEVQRAVLVLCLRRGRRSEAVRRYRLMVQAVQREFGETLDFALSELSADHDLRLA